MRRVEPRRRLTPQRHVVQAQALSSSARSRRGGPRGLGRRAVPRLGPPHGTQHPEQVLPAAERFPKVPVGVAALQRLPRLLHASSPARLRAGACRKGAGSESLRGFQGPECADESRREWDPTRPGPELSPPELLWKGLWKG